MARALITGITGQDGSLLADHLLQLGYEVTGAIHAPLSKNDPKLANYAHLLERVKFVLVDFGDGTSCKRLIDATTPDECYHLAAQSFITEGFTGDFSPFVSNVQSVYHLHAALSAYPKTKLFFAGSAEIFGNNSNQRMNEESEARPRTLYGISKLAGRELIRNYRERGSFACTGYLFNHESPRRGEEFVTRKITMAAARIKQGHQKELLLGSLDAKKDWSWAPDFVAAFHKMLQLPEPQDMVLGSGELHTVGDFAKLAFNAVGLNAMDYIKIDERFIRPQPQALVADTTKANRLIGWKPTKTFQEIVEALVKHDFDLVSKTK